MLKIKSMGLVLLGLLLFSTWAGAAPLQDYKLAYVFKNPDGSVFRIIRYYLRDNNKYRTEYITTVQMQINNSESHLEYLGVDAEPHTIEILRKDRNLVWTLDPSFKVYSQVAMRPDVWVRVIGAYFVADFSGLKKAGETQLLNYPCDIYQSAEQDGWSNIFAIARDFNVVLKNELYQNGKLVQIMESMEFSREKPAAALFELPVGYKKN